MDHENWEFKVLAITVNNAEWITELPIQWQDKDAKHLDITWTGTGQILHKPTGDSVATVTHLHDFATKEAVLILWLYNMSIFWDAKCFPEESHD